MPPISKSESQGFELTDGEGNRILVRRVFTKKGKRLEVTSSKSGTRNRLDALALESITWQDQSTFTHELQESIQGTISEDFPSIDETVDEIYFSNEFAEVTVSKLPSGHGVVISSEKLPYSIELDLEGLEGLSAQDPERISEFLETPYGPEG